MRATATIVALMLSLLVTGMGCQRARASLQQDVLTEISAALGRGDAAGLALYFPASVGISVLQKAPVYYSKQQAQQVLTDFFEKNKPRKFEKAHAGGQSNAQFTMGDLTTSSGVYRVTFFLKEVNGQTQIQNLIIDKK